MLCPLFLACAGPKLLSLVQSDEIDPLPFYTHHVDLADLPTAYETFAQRKENVLKMFVQTEYGKQLQGGRMSGASSIVPISARAKELQLQPKQDAPSFSRRRAARPSSTTCTDTRSTCRS